jgi:alpha-methylacyl-CoA racemase
MTAQFDASSWPAMRQAFEDTFKSEPRAHWCELLEGTDACFAPVLTSAEAAAHPHMSARESFTGLDGVVQSAPAPRFSRTPGAIQGSGSRPGADADGILADWGFDPARIATLKQDGVVS